MRALTRHEWHGAENLPDEGFLACSNHLSYVDPISLAHFLYDNDKPPHFLAKREVFEVPGIGTILRKADQIPVYRQSAHAIEAFRAAVAAVEDGKCVVVYPEGTLTRDPDLWPMTGKTGAARIALQTRCPVVPIGQWGPQEILLPYARKPRLFPRKTMRVTAGPVVDLSDLYDVPETKEVQVEATDRIIAAITTIVEQLRAESAPTERWDARKHGQPPTGAFRREDGAA